MKLNREYSDRINEALAAARDTQKQTQTRETVLDFDIRGILYGMAHMVAPRARDEEIKSIHEWLRPLPGEKGIDIAAGSGFLTKHLVAWTGGNVYAVDPSKTQIDALRANVPDAIPVHGYPDDEDLVNRMPCDEINFATSLGGIHHVSDQHAMFCNVSRILIKGGRFILADVCAETSLSRHFDEIVATKCLTGHTAQWLSKSRVEKLIEKTGFALKRSELLHVHMDFENEEQMAVFFKGLHAYDLPDEEVIGDLQNILGTKYVDDAVRLNWPLLFVELEKID